jgi:hypothetical protein
MGNRQLLVEEFREMVEVLQDASHEKMGELTVHTGIHPEMGEIVTSSDQDAVLIHG